MKKRLLRSPSTKLRTLRSPSTLRQLADRSGLAMTDVVIILLILQALINLIGALGPELSFDSLWYHLTLPKIYLQHKSLAVIPGGLLYYSGFPQLMEMIYGLALIFGNTILAKIIHFSFGLGYILALYQLLKRFGRELALLGCLIFYSQLVVGWLCTTAYVDLARTFFEILALKFFLDWQQLKKRKSLMLTGIMIGLAISTKLLAVYSLITFGLLIVLLEKRKRIASILWLCLPSLLIILPWLIRSFIYTGNPVYPLLTTWFFKAQSNGLNLSDWLLSRQPINFIKVLLKTTFTTGDILSPIIIIGLPLILFKIKRSKEVLVVGLYFLFSFLLFFLTPLNDNRFLLPYLGGFIYLLLVVVSALKAEEIGIKKIFYISVFLVALLNLGSRGVSNKKFLAIILDRQTKADFFGQYLNFEAGNFYDLDGWFKNNIKKDDKVLIMGVHNLYYVDFPFDHISWAKKGTYYSHILVQNQSLPEIFGNLALLYENDKMKIKVYSFKENLI